MGKYFACLPVLMVVLFTSLVDSLTYCHAGSYYIPLKDGQHACELCEPGTFMPHHDHQITQCYDCMKIEDPMLEILISQCDGKKDSVINCVSGYYRRLRMNPEQKDRCEKCTNCSQHHLYMTRGCQTYTDTHCCMEENYMVAKNVDGVDICHELPWFCRRGEYFDTESNECKPCPTGTFMSLDYHVMKECMECLSTSELDLPLHSVVLHQCNKTRPAVLGCEEGYFIDHTKGRGGRDVGCSPCVRCDEDGMFEGRSCDHHHNTVCCPQPNMIVVDNPDGLHCQESTIVSTTVESTVESPDVLHCSEGFCIYTNMCVPCELLDQCNHTHIVNTSDTKPKKLNDHTGQPEEISWSLVSFITVGIIVIILTVIVLYKVPRIHKAVGDCTTRLSHHHLERRYPQTCDIETADEIVVEHIGHILRNVAVPFLQADERDEKDENITTEGTSNERIKESSREKLKDEIEKFYEGVRSRKGNTVTACRHTSELLEEKKYCKKNDGHQEFTPALDFTLEHLPEGHRNMLVWDYIQTVIFLAVRVVVNYTSEDRPDDYKDSNPRFGSGMVRRVYRKFTEEEDGRRCPCRECKKFPYTAKTRWGQFRVYTAAHVVYNSEECKHSRCDVGYSRDEDKDKCEKLDGVEVWDSDIEKDLCLMHCVTHDENLVDKMEMMVSHYHDLRDKLHDQYKRSEYNDMSKVPVICISHPHGISKHVTVGVMRDRQNFSPWAWSYTTQTCPGSSGAPVFALGKIKDEVVSCHHSIHSKFIQQGGQCGYIGWHW